ncbi:hypothetical protein LXL04_037577 [Taraxacum kok-saghyz]
MVVVSSLASFPPSAAWFKLPLYPYGKKEFDTSRRKREQFCTPATNLSFRSTHNQSENIKFQNQNGARYYKRSNRRESTSESLLLDLLDAENDHLVDQGYSEQQRFIDIRPIAYHYCLKHADMIVAYNALTYYDRFLARNFDIPGLGFERNLELFVFACIGMVYREMFQEYFDFHYFVNSHHVADERDVRKMELLIWNGLEGSEVTPPNAIDPFIIDPLLSLLEMEDQLPDLVHYVDQILFAINKDIKFTKFRPSILAASAILVTCFRLHPVLYPTLAKKIFKSGYVQQVLKDPDVRKFILLTEVRECLDELKDHVITEFVFGPEKCPLYRRWFSRELGKELMIDDPSIRYEYVPNPEHPLDFYLENHEDFLDDFRAERQNQEQITSAITIHVEEEEDRELTSESTEEEELLDYGFDIEDMEDISESVEEEEDDEDQEHSSEIPIEEEEHRDTSDIIRDLEEVFRTWRFPRVEETEIAKSESEGEGESE